MRYKLAVLAKYIKNFLTTKGGSLNLTWPYTMTQTCDTQSESNSLNLQRVERLTRFAFNSLLVFSFHFFIEKNITKKYL